MTERRWWRWVRPLLTAIMWSASALGLLWHSWRRLGLGSLPRAVALMRARLGMQESQAGWVEDERAWHHFRLGLREPLPSYFGEGSRVRVESLEQVEAFLRSCIYRKLHGDGRWIRPSSFEFMRMGVCRDHALWGLGKIHELGLEVKLVAGLVLKTDPQDGSTTGASRHAWLEFFDEDGHIWLMETTEKGDAPMRWAIGPGDLPTRHCEGRRYIPLAAIDRAGQTYLHGAGNALVWWRFDALLFGEVG